MPDKNDWFFDSSEFDPTAKSLISEEASLNLSDARVPDPTKSKETLNQSTDDCEYVITQMEANFSRLDSFDTNKAEYLTKLLNESPKSRSGSALTAETLRILSSIKIENLGFNSQFDLLFNDLSMLKATAVQGLLGTTNFRFLAWMIFLECLPMNKDMWFESISQNRLDYENIKKSFLCDPRRTIDSSGNKVIDHPLSDDESSLWNKYFCHKEVRSVIIQDVNRIAIFKALMSRINDWFGTKSTSKLSKSMIESFTLNRRNSLTSLTPKLFQNTEEFYESVIINKINYIADKVLQNNDIEVFNHLNLIGVTLHPFGIRWLRLLFLRELEFPSCLILWDAIFATDNKELNLVNYLFVALLMCLRDEILSMDNSNCMKLLMQPHFYLDPLDVLKTALYLQNPAVYKRPDSMENSYELVNSSHPKDHAPKEYRARSNHLNMSSLSIPTNRTTKSEHPDNNNNQLNKTRIPNSISTGQLNKKKMILATNSEFDLNKLIHKLDYDYPSKNSNRSVRNVELKLRGMEHTSHNTDLVTHAYISKIQEIQDENLRLKDQLEAQADLCSLASVKIESNVQGIEEQLSSFEGLDKDDLLVLAIDGLKQISKQLKSNFEFSNAKNERL